MIRIGQGYDVHRLIKGRALILGGVTVDHDRGLEGHSDADVLIHSLCDALLGAAGKGDIGRHFPDNDRRYENIDSRILLREVVGQIAEDGWEVVNADITVVAQAPRLAPYLDQMKQNLSMDIGVDEHQVNIKATTTEHLGFAGREEGIAAMAVALIERKG
jgi:2-C-methyl-D-erythritol 2,4-cyclodiphosphate synthase